MRNLYRERRHVCGEYLDIDVYPVVKQTCKSGRSKKAKPTSEIMKKYNQRCRELKLERLIMANFNQGEAIFWNPSYKDEFLPADDKAAKRSLKNFLDRLKRYRKKKDLPELKYIAVTEKGKRSGRYHHHLIMNCSDMTTAELDKIWGMGFCYSSLVQFDKDGVQGLSKYFCKKSKPTAEGEEETADEEKCGNAWSSSRNLVKPKVTKRDGKISMKRVKELNGLGNDGGAEWEKLYPDYDFSVCRTLYNEVNGGYYIAVRMRRKPPKKPKKRKEH